MNQSLVKLQQSGEISTILPDNKLYKNRFEIKSESSNRLYVIAQNKGTNAWSCSCFGWIRFRKCKHLSTLQPLLGSINDDEHVPPPMKRLGTKKPSNKK